MSSIPDSESVFPGENWFFYWRTSASLWEGKIRAYTAPGPLFVPLYWGFHGEGAESFDFGEHKPEADLARLAKAVRDAGRELIFLLPLTPVPFQPNGGLPSFLARSPAQDGHGMTQAFVDAEGSIHKAHSFYDPRVYQSFRKYVWQLNGYLEKANVAAEVRGMQGSWVEGSYLKSSLEDFSPAFVQGYLRYLKQQNIPVKIAADGQETSGLPASQENLQITRYRKLIGDLYQQTASESLSNFWGGEHEYGFLGGSPTDIFPLTAEEWPLKEALMADLLAMLEWDVLPSSVLLPPATKQGLLERFLREHLTPSYVQQRLQRPLAGAGDSGAFLPLVFFDFFWDQLRRDNAVGELTEQGLLPYAQREFRGCWRWRTGFDWEKESEDESEKLKFFFSAGMERPRFQHVLRLFLQGQKVILDRSGLDPLLDKKLQLFITENDLRPQSINFLTPISLIRLGDGMLLMYDGARLKDHPIAKKLEFWGHLTKYLQLRHLAVGGENPPIFQWKTRLSSPHELNYGEIRRISFYNPTDSRMRCQILSAKNFAFLKVVDPLHSQARSTPMGVDVEVGPFGAVSLDFGHFEG